MTGGLLDCWTDSVCFSVLKVRKKRFRRINDIHIMIAAWQE